jgi:predicted Zn-dependent peptidase
MHEDYYTADLLSDVLGRGKSSRLHKELVNKRRLFSSITSYISGSIDPGLMTIHGKLNKNVSIEEGEAGIHDVLEYFQKESLPEEEMLKVKNQAESSIIFSEMDLLTRAMNLAYSALLGNPNLVNMESVLIQQVQAEDLHRFSREMLRPENSSTLYYHAKN